MIETISKLPKLVFSTDWLVCQNLLSSSDPSNLVNDLVVILIWIMRKKENKKEEDYLPKLMC